MLSLTGASYRYPTGQRPAVGPVDLEVRGGELVLLTGPTGCGKSTLLRLAAGLLQRHGHGALGGQIAVAGLDPALLSPAERARRVGFVSQEPGDQIVAGTLSDEVAFGLESAGWPAEAMEPRVRACLAQLGLPLELGRSPRALSGGQRQRLVVAAALAAGAGLLLLDEPLAQLDPAGAQALMAELRRTADSGVAVLLVEHRLAACLSHVDRVLVMDGGRLVADQPPSGLDPALLGALGLRVAAYAGAPRPMSVATGENSQALIVVDGLNIYYEKNVALQGVSLTIRPGERVALLGANGSGKSTLIGALSGRVRSGAVRRVGRVVEVPQEADLTLFCEDVAAELGYAPREARVGRAAREARVEAAASGLSVGDLLGRAPQALSRGQRLRVAVAAALTVDAPILLLDEPTAGQDQAHVERMMAALEGALGPQAALVFATHDLDLARRYGLRWVILEGGRVLADGTPEAVAAALPAALGGGWQEGRSPPTAPFGGTSPTRGEGGSAPSAVVVEGGSALPAALGGGWQEGRSPPTAPFGGTSPTRGEGGWAPSAVVVEGGSAPSAVVGKGGSAPSPLVGEGWGGGVPAIQPADPRTRLGLLVAAGLVCLALDRPLSLLLLCCITALPLFFLRIERRWLLGGALGVLTLIWSTTLSQGLFYADEPRVMVARLGPLALYREGLAHGLVQSLRLIAMTLGGLALSLSTPPDRLFAALQALRVPFGVAFLAVTALRFVPEVGREWLTVREARAARGRPLWRRGPWAWISEEVALLRPVVARSLRRARALAESLDVRGFDPLISRTHYRPLRMSRGEGALLAFALSFAALLVALRLLYVLYTAELLYLPALRPLYGFVRGWL